MILHAFGAVAHAVSVHDAQLTAYVKMVRSKARRTFARPDGAKAI